jgi:uncharacterized damage-inducible protein DinB
MAAFKRPAAVARHREEMARLLRIARVIPSGRRDEPVYRVWTAKDLLGHIAAWDRWLCGAIDALVAGRRPKFGRTSVFNKHAVDASRALDWAAVLRDVRTAHTALMRRIEALSDAEWTAASRHRYRWGDSTAMTIASLFAYTYKGGTHYGGHAREIEAWLAARRG